MDSTEHSKAVGVYLGQTIRRRLEHFVFALRYGRGRPLKNPFNGEKLDTKVSPEVQRLANMLAERGLSKDSELMVCVANAVASFATDPVEHILQDLLAYQEHGDGGPDPEFGLVFPKGEQVRIRDTLSGFQQSRAVDSDEVEERALRLAIDWPRNDRAFAACACCGYHTLVNSPNSGETCPVCHWMDSCDLQDPWNTDSWGQLEDPIEEFRDDLPVTSDWKRITIAEARANYLHTGMSSPQAAGWVRKPLGQELPCYDWSSDRRPYSSGKGQA